MNFYISAVTRCESTFELRFDGPKPITEGDSASISRNLNASIEHSDGLLIVYVTHSRIGIYIALQTS